MGDYDGDGFPDMYVTCYGRSLLYHNNGNGTFTDVTEKAGVSAPGWATALCGSITTITAGLIYSSVVMSISTKSNIIAAWLQKWPDCLTKPHIATREATGPPRAGSFTTMETGLLPT